MNRTDEPWKILVEKMTNNAAEQHANPKSDIEIAQAATMKPVLPLVEEKLGVPPEMLEPYGHYKAKVSLEYIDSLKNKPDGKLVLVTAITPTTAGEGKTTTTVGLGDALAKIGRKSIFRSADGSRED